jgi:hypothetical protein
VKRVFDFRSGAELLALRPDDQPDQAAQIIELIKPRAFH